MAVSRPTCNTLIMAKLMIGRQMGVSMASQAPSAIDSPIYHLF
jgi:hypothetical protein